MNNVRGMSGINSFTRSKFYYWIFSTRKLCYWTEVVHTAYMVLPSSLYILDFKVWISSSCPYLHNHGSFLKCFTYLILCVYLKNYFPFQNIHPVLNAPNANDLHLLSILTACPHDIAIIFWGTSTKTKILSFCGLHKYGLIFSHNKQYGSVWSRPGAAVCQWHERLNVL